MGYDEVIGRFRFGGSGLMLAVGVLVQGCTAQLPATSSRTAGTTDQAVDVPAGAIRVGEQLYQVPIGADDGGCPMFRLYSPTRLVAQVIYYRHRAGGFTMNREEAACPGGMPG